MFETFANTKRGLFSNKYFLAIVVISIVGHVGAGATMLVSSMWKISYTQLPPIETKAYTAMLSGGGPPPAAQKAKKIEKRVVEDTQLVERKDDDPTDEQIDKMQTSDNVGVGTGVGGVGGGGGGIGTGIGTGIGDGIGTKAPPPAPKEKVVAPSVLRSARISGDDPSPDRPDKLAIARSGSNRILGVWRICVNKGGSVKSVSRKKSTGYPTYDRKLERAMRKWRYKPMMVDGKAASMCGNTTVIYRVTKTGM